MMIEKTIRFNNDNNMRSVVGCGNTPEKSSKPKLVEYLPAL